MQEVFIGRDIGHRISVMRKADIAVRIDDTIQRHTTQFKELDLLPVFLGDQVVRVGQTDEGNPFILPILLEGRKSVWPNSQDFHTAVYKLLIFITQARQLRAAVWSHETAQEGKQDGLSAKIR